MCIERLFFKDSVSHLFCVWTQKQTALATVMIPKFRYYLVKGIQAVFHAVPKNVHVIMRYTRIHVHSDMHNYIYISSFRYA